VIRTIPVGLGERAYEVLIGRGLIAEAGRRIRPFLKRDRVAVVSDEIVWSLHGAALTSAMAAAGISVPANRPRASGAWPTSPTACWPWNSIAAT
jgi:3-dehydroquinate synthetase